MFFERRSWAFVDIFWGVKWWRWLICIFHSVLNWSTLFRIFILIKLVFLFNLILSSSIEYLVILKLLELQEWRCSSIAVLLCLKIHMRFHKNTQTEMINYFYYFSSCFFPFFPLNYQIPQIIQKEWINSKNISIKNRFNLWLWNNLNQKPKQNKLGWFIFLKYNLIYYSTLQRIYQAISLWPHFIEKSL